MNYIIEHSIFNYEPAREPAPGSPLQRFIEHLSRPEEQIDLVEAAMMIASSEYPGLDVGHYLRRLETMANDVRVLLADETDPHKQVEVLNSYLFKTIGFKGNQDNYNDPRNSFLNDVLERRTGIPISISLVYIEVGRQAGLPLEGVGLPGHFIVRLRRHAPQTHGRLEWNGEPVPERKDKEILLDPFNGGAFLTLDDCARLISEMYGRPMPMVQSFLHPVGNRAFLKRILNNLKSNYITFKDFDKALRTVDYLLALDPKDWEEVRDRGLLHQQADHKMKALVDLQSYLRHRPSAKDTEQIRTQINDLQREIGKNN